MAQVVPQLSCIGLRDDTGDAASIFSTVGFDVASYTTLRIE